MSVHFHKLKIKNIIKETDDCVSVSFIIPESLKKNFHYKAGQNITLRKFFDNEDVRRSYSLCSSPLDDECRVAIKKVQSGKFSSFANEQLKQDDELDVMEPTGSFFIEPDEIAQKKYLAFAAGSGITPVISMLKTILHAEPQSRFTLVYGNKKRKDIIFLEELQALKNKFTDRLELVFILSREKNEADINNGRIDKEKLAQLEKLIDYKATDEIFICGPEAMIFTIKDFLLKKNIAANKIKFELFNTSGIQTKNETVQETHIKNYASAITIKMDDRQFNFTIAENENHSLLDAGISAGLDLPFSCKGGMCCTCKAKLIEGQVKMKTHWGLDDDEIKKGFILCCQAYPQSEKIFVDFDIK